MGKNQLSEPAPSNSRLSDHFRSQLHRISWDRMTVIGDLEPSRAKGFRNFIACNPAIRLLNAGSDYFVSRAYNDLFYLDYDKKKGQALERRSFRCEFNPNNCDEGAKSFFVERILPNLKNVGFSRLDLAFDVVADLNTFLVETETPLQQNVIYGRDGKAETRYFGSRDSERYIRIYNKKRERKENAGEMLDFPHLWRVEFELKRQAVDAWDKVFDGVIIKQPDIDSIEDFRTRAAVHMLLSDHSQWGNLSARVRYKYRKIIREMHGAEIHTALKAALKKEKGRLQEDLESWIGKSLADS